METKLTTDDTQGVSVCQPDRHRKLSVILDAGQHVGDSTDKKNSRSYENFTQNPNEMITIESKAEMKGSNKEELSTEITEHFQENGVLSHGEEPNNKSPGTNNEIEQIVLLGSGLNQRGNDNSKMQRDITEAHNSQNIHGDANIKSVSSDIDKNDTETEMLFEQRAESEMKSVGNEIVYDETKPKRIQNPNKLKISIPPEDTRRILDGIDKLISPDEVSSAKRSPHRRRNASVEKPVYDNPVRGRPIVVYNEADEDTDRDSKDDQQVMDLQQVQEYVNKQSKQNPKEVSEKLQIPEYGRNGHRNHYQKSPDMKRKFHSSEFDGHDLTRRSESPVLRLKNRSESAQNCSKYGRKISLDARLGDSNAASSVVKRDPIRKISSHARLENVAAPTGNEINVEPKYRRVSFGATTYINSMENGLSNKPGSKRLSEPLYTQIQGSDQMRTGACNDIRSDTESVLNSECKMYATPAKECMSENINIHVEDDNKARIILSDHQNESLPIKVCQNEQYDNKAYVDDETILERRNKQGPKPKIIDSQTGTPLEVKKKADYSDSRNSSTESLIQFQTDRSFVPTTNKKKLSTHSLPGESSRGHEQSKKKSRHSDETNGWPKSILKVKTDDSVSNASTESLSRRAAKARKDSVTVYHDRNGDLVTKTKQDRGPWVAISRKDLKRLWDSRYDLLARYKVHVVVFIVFLLTLIFVIVGVKLQKPRTKAETTAKNALIFDPDYRRIHLFDDDELDEIEGVLGMEIPEGVPASNCYLNFDDGQEMKCLSWEEYAELTIVHKSYNKTQCYDIRWTLNPGVRLHDCYDTKGAYWYGPSNSSQSHWPLKHSRFSFDSLGSVVMGTFSSVTEYMWLSSKGAAIIIDSNFPVHIVWNEKLRETFCISRSYLESYSPDVLHSNRQVQYTICNGVNILETYSLVRKNFFPKLSHTPDNTLLSSPHWSTVSESASLKINDSIVTEITQNLRKNNLECSSVELDGQWQLKYGDFSFDNDAFSNIDEMLNGLSSVGCDLSVKLYPYVNFLSGNFKEGLVNEYFVKSSGGNAPALLQWEHGVGAMIDVAKSDAQDWLSSILRSLTISHGITTIRFGYGNSVWLPSNAAFHAEKMFPDRIMELYSKFMDNFGHVIFEKTSQTQNIPSLISVSSGIIEKDERKCLKNIIPHVLAIGLLGYPFMILDGFQHKDSSFLQDQGYPSRDLFIRWMQLSSFIPASKYTIKPWQYDEDMVMISKNLTKFHQDKVLPIVDSMKNKILSGEPIIRPMWWVDPIDETAFSIDDQFLLGSNMMVAPVLCEERSGVAERNIYFPKGIWRDSLTNALIPGPKWVQYYRVDQTQIPVFTKEVLFESVHDRIK